MISQALESKSMAGTDFLAIIVQDPHRLKLSPQIKASSNIL